MDSLGISLPFKGYVPCCLDIGDWLSLSEALELELDGGGGVGQGVRSESTVGVGILPLDVLLLGESLASVVSLPHAVGLHDPVVIESDDLGVGVVEDVIAVDVGVHKDGSDGPSELCVVGRVDCAMLVAGDPLEFHTRDCELLVVAVGRWPP